MEQNALTGKIISVLPLQTGIGKVSGKAWKKQEYVLETSEQYPKKICFELWGDHIDLYRLEVGQEVRVYVDLESREHNGRWYTSVKAWKVEKLSIGATQGVATSADPFSAVTATTSGQPWDSTPRPTPAPQTDLPF